MGYYRQALRLKPAYADASNNLATAYKEQGLLDEAVAQFQETLKLQPDHALAYYNLGKFAAEGRYQFAPDELGRIKAVMASGRCTASERSLCILRWPWCSTQHGSHDEAFRYYRQANELKSRLLKERHVSFDAQATRP